MKLSLYERPSSRRLPSRSRSARLTGLSAVDEASRPDACGGPARAHRTTDAAARSGSHDPRAGARPHCGGVWQRSMWGRRQACAGEGGVYADGVERAGGGAGPVPHCTSGCYVEAGRQSGEEGARRGCAVDWAHGAIGTRRARDDAPSKWRRRREIGRSLDPAHAPLVYASLPAAAIERLSPTVHGVHLPCFPKVRTSINSASPMLRALRA
jgi:hypothetical protein